MHKKWQKQYLWTQRNGRLFKIRLRILLHIFFYCKLNWFSFRKKEIRKKFNMNLFPSLSCMPPKLSRFFHKLVTVINSKRCEQWAESEYIADSPAATSISLKSYGDNNAVPRKDGIYSKKLGRGKESMKISRKHSNWSMYMYFEEAVCHSVENCNIHACAARVFLCNTNHASAGLTALDTDEKWEVCGTKIRINHQKFLTIL